ncbi:MAG: hypothetical protein RIM83_13425 [Allomuricauda sp.]
MKHLILLFLLPFVMNAQESEEQKSHFVALYTVGALWDMDKQPNDQPYFKEHSAFLSKLRKENTIVMGARYSDTGIIVLQATDLESAKSLLSEDVALQNQLFNVEVHPFNVFYKGCFD